MGHKNYSKFSEKFKKPENNEVNVSVEENNDVMEEIFDQVMDEIVTSAPIEKVVGVVTGCSKLNVRKEASKDSEPLCAIDKDVEVAIDLENSTEEFYKIITPSDIEGYCMKKFITIK